MTDTLTWLLTKKTSSLRVKRNGAEFTREEFNLMNKNCPKYSGLAATKAVDLSIHDKKILLTTKNVKKGNKPKKSRNSVPLNKGFHAVSSLVASRLEAHNYRSDLKSAALVRLNLLNRVAKIQNGANKIFIKTRRNQKQE